MSTHLDQLEESGLEIALTRHGKPVAKLVRYTEEEKAWKKFFGFMADNGESGVQYENRVRRNKKEKSYTESLRKQK